MTSTLTIENEHVNCTIMKIFRTQKYIERKREKEWERMRERVSNSYEIQWQDKNNVLQYRKKWIIKKRLLYWVFEINKLRLERRWQTLKIKKSTLQASKTENIRFFFFFISTIQIQACYGEDFFRFLWTFVFLMPILEKWYNHLIHVSTWPKCSETIKFQNYIIIGTQFHKMIFHLIFGSRHLVRWQILVAYHENCIRTIWYSSVFLNILKRSILPVLTTTDNWQIYNIDSLACMHRG